MENKKGKNKKKEITRTLVLILIVIVVIYILYTIISLIKQPTNIVVVENGKLTMEEETIGYVVRDEAVLQGENYKNGMVKIKGEGERVEVGASIFRYYSKDEENLIKKIEELDEKIDEAMEGEKGILSSDIKVLDTKIEKNLEEIYMQNDMLKISEIKKSIEDAVSKKATITGERSPAGSYVKKLIDERASYEYKLNSGTEDVKTDLAGIVSYKVDGLEKVLSPNDFTNLTPETLNGLNLRTGQTIQESEESGKIINNFRLFIAVISDSKEAKEAKVGKKVKIKLSTKEELPSTIIHINEAEDGKRVIIFETNNYSIDLINYRKVSMDIIWWSDEGLKVPNSAIEKDGELSYVTRNRAGYLDKIYVKVLRTNDSYSIVGKYSTDELKELGFTSSEIIDMKNIAIYDEIVVKHSQK